MKKVVVLLVCVMTLGFAAFAQAAQYPETQKNLMAAITGETGAAAHYRAFAEVAANEGHREIANIFRATADAEAKHAADQYLVLRSLDNTVTLPSPGPLTVGTTRQNLQAAINGETEEYTQMYPSFIVSADAEGASFVTGNRGMFRLAMRAEEQHAIMFKNLLDNIDNLDKGKYGIAYRCLLCGHITLTSRPDRCIICGDLGTTMPEYKSSPYLYTEINLMAAITGETGAAAHYRAFAEVAGKNGHKGIADIFRAVGDAEAKHASDQFDILLTMDNRVKRPTADPVTTGTTKQNLQAAIDGETYEYKVMYPEFIDDAIAEGMAANHPARRIMNLAMRAEEVHAILYTDLHRNFPRFDSAKYETLYRCTTCGNIYFNTTPNRCEFCGERSEDFVVYDISSGFGCNAGYASLALLFIPFVLRRRD